MPEPHPHAYSRLYQLREALAAKEITAGLSNYVVTVYDSAGDLPRVVEMVTCRGRVTDGGKAWFWDSKGRPLAEADRITDAVVAIMGNLGSAS
jgi:hypothetical protein